MIDINLLTTSLYSLPPSCFLVSSIHLSVSCLSFLALSYIHARARVCIYIYIYLSLTLSLSHSLTHSLFAHSLHTRQRVVHGVVTLVYTPYASVRKYTHVRFTRTTGADRTTSPRLQRRKRSRRDGGWGSLSARRSRFPTSPRAVTPGPREQPRTYLALLRSPPLPCLSYPLWLYIEPPPSPYVPIPRGSSERMFCHHTTPHAVLPPSQLPEQPPQSPSILFPHSLSFALPPPSPELIVPLPQGVAADTLATTYTPRISALGIPSAPCACVRMRFVVEGASFRRLCVREYAYDDAGRRQSASVHALKCTLASACRFAVSLIRTWCFLLYRRYGT